MLKELSQDEGQTIVFIDGSHHVGAAAEGSMDAGNMLKPSSRASCIAPARHASTNTAST